MLFTGAFGAVALALSVLGIFGLVSYAASQRMRELGVRIALGAQPREIVALVVGQGLRPVAAGVAAGAVGAFAASRYLESMLFGVSATDPLTFAAVALLLAAAAVAACWLPARRAAAVDPLTVLRSE
jgi:ABC-type antimicrobial peptide transport system permease subunit